MLKSTRRLRVYAVFLRNYFASQSPSAPQIPALLSKVREDMKSAMRAKDTARLDVLRGLISDTTNANKTSHPIATDSDVLQIIRKRVKTSQDAAAEAKNAQRQDLLAREQQQLSILESYIRDSNALSGEQVTAAVQQAMDDLTALGKNRDKGAIMKALLGPDGILQGQLVDRKEVATIVDGIL